MTRAVDTADWTSPGAFEVAPDLFRIPLPLPGDALKAVNVYALLDDDGLALIDSGWGIPQAREELSNALALIGRELGDVHQVFVTHVHRDHYGQAAMLRREFGSRVWLGAEERRTLDLAADPGFSFLDGEIALLRSRGAGSLADDLAHQRETNGMPPREETEYPDEWLVPGQVSAAGQTLTVIHTPGHTQGHVVFHDEQRSILLAGDHVLPSITPSIGFEAARTASPLGAFLSSLAIVRDRPDALLAPAHGAVTSSVHARVDELLEHHATRLDETAAAVKDGAHTSYEVASVLKWTRRLRSLDSLDLFNQMLAVNETDAHLQVLLAQDRARATMIGGIQHFS